MTAPRDKAREMMRQCDHPDQSERAYICEQCVAAALIEAANVSQKPETSDASGGYVAEKDEAQAAALEYLTTDGILMRDQLPDYGLFCDAYRAGVAKGREMGAEIAEKHSKNCASCGCDGVQIAAVIRGSGK